MARGIINYKMMWNDLKNIHIKNVELSDEDKGKAYISDIIMMMNDLECDYEE
ncbi:MULTISPECIES: hypothetical protein [Paenibacillus]|uniref:hypothetical protein n=1 Tax=Paenibacillus TaxID=44249 RepID=UPI000429D991|nr:MULTISPECIES: hypothetical protein [Paenibacillus]